ncbi:Mediator of RNA polymerase II transcription subunit [Golovinomyces cichoracearum]|uniref:Mediator of RNA polymerase II transcription subunit 1 n=1 Tax=Golovinomyces cichoracearum TaxID=62708 RepID=A0A420IJX4_9PEZI|nr:Mediator of RNA polymerase II transcription subunit [Golovinomyces cichoracearum]
MATPTPGKHVLVQAVATPPGSTPFSSSTLLPGLAFSPRPQSVGPSPQQTKKSPANSQMIFNNGTTSSFGAGYDSPSAAIALGGISVLSDLGLDGLSGVAGLRRDDEEERRRKLELVGDILKQNLGRVGELGIERLAKMVGFECLWESKFVGRSSLRTLIIAGSTLALDIDLDSNIVKTVSLTYPDSLESVTRHIEKANDILLKDLKLEKNESPLTKTLDRFAKNLKHLATLDKMSVLPNLNCHEAIAGIYESLNKLNKWECERLRETGEVTNIEKNVMCTKSGRPMIHTRQRLGLSLDYWQDSWRIESKVETLNWSILIECDTMAPLAYTPIRSSENWISSDIIKKDLPLSEDLTMASDNGLQLDWLEPENTLLPATEGSAMNSLGQTSNENFPEVMFVAKFDPPLVVPGSVAAQIYDSVQATLDMYQTTTYDGLIHPHSTSEKINIDSRSIFRDIIVPIFSKSGEKTTRNHQVGLHFEKVDYGRTLTTIPFSHPRQIVEMLPALRQYALMSRLLHNIIDTSSQSQSESPKNQKLESKKFEFESFMSNEIELEEIPTKVDILVTTQPFPRIRVTFPFKKMIADIHFEIKLNGVVEVIAQNILSPDLVPDSLTGKMLTEADLGRILEITESLPIWIEFVRRRLA